MAITEEVLKVQGMSCNHCKMAVEKSLKNLPGVTGADVDLPAGTVCVTYDPGSASHDQIVAAIDKAGYKVSE
ncbi:MAG: heavy-metal-associated domain-containing protein [Bacillota bacterium]